MDLFPKSLRILNVLHLLFQLLPIVSITNVNITTVLAQEDPSAYSLNLEVRGLVGDSISIEEKVSQQTLSSITTNGEYTFQNQILVGTKFRLKITKQPMFPEQSCTIENGLGKMSKSRYTNKKIVVTCRTPIRHVVIIGIDGMGGAYLRNEEKSVWNVRMPSLPTLDSLQSQSSWTYLAQDALPTKSSPNWCSMLSGNSPDVHGVLSNSWARGDSIIPPTLFAVTREEYPTSSIGLLYDWAGLGILIEDDVADVKFSPGDADDTVDAAKEFMIENHPLLTFIHLDLCDGAGHSYGWGSEEYVSSLESADGMIESIIDTLKEESMWNYTALLISADHGGDGYNHGPDTYLDRSIPFIVRTPQSTGKRISREVRIWDVAATSAALLGISHPEYWVSNPIYEAIPFSPEWESISTSDIYFQQLDEFTLLFDSNGTDMRNDLSIIRPKVPTGYVSLGDIALNMNSGSSPQCDLDDSICGCANDQSDYRGNINTTISGRVCQKWTAQSPHTHTRTPENYPYAGLGDHNYCRNPDGEDGAWCYTKDESERWESCNVPSCPTKPRKLAQCQYDKTNCSCMNDNSDYRGMISTTISGRVCQKWTAQSPHTHTRTPENYPYAGLGDHNYCRNPDGEDSAWCYTTDESERWESCNVPSCPFVNLTAVVIQKNHPAVAYPKDYELIWSSEGMSNDTQSSMLALWNPLPPPGGYTCPGQVIHTSYDEQPNVTDVACIMETYLSGEEIDGSIMIWNSAGIESDMDGSIWSCTVSPNVTNDVIDPTLYVSRRESDNPGHNSCRVLEKLKFSLCEDDESFRFKNREANDCSWVGLNASRRCEKKWKRKRIYKHCPVTCGKC